MHYLDFKGRVHEVSLKNFQLVHWDHNRNQLGTDLVLLFGKKEHSEYAVDFCYPMNALQAFALGECWCCCVGGVAGWFYWRLWQPLGDTHKVAHDKCVLTSPCL